MKVSQVREYMRRHRQVPLRELARAFRTDEDVMRSALGLLQRKQLVDRLPAGTLCHGCRLCPPEAVEIYRWLPK